jgi:hypothetical protein
MIVPGAMLSGGAAYYAVWCAGFLVWLSGIDGATTSEDWAELTVSQACEIAVVPITAPPTAICWLAWAADLWESPAHIGPGQAFAEGACFLFALASGTGWMGTRWGVLGWGIACLLALAASAVALGTVLLYAAATAAC